MAAPIPPLYEKSKSYCIPAAKIPTLVRVVPKRVVPMAGLGAFQPKRL